MAGKVAARASGVGEAHNFASMIDNGVHDELFWARPQPMHIDGVDCGSIGDRLRTEPFEAPYL
jgi:hypothetical protein